MDSMSDILTSIKKSVPDYAICDPANPPEPKFEKIGYCMDDCTVCSGLGYVQVNPKARPGDPDFGKVENCPNAVVPVSDRYMQNTGLSPLEMDLDWNIIKPDWYNVGEAIQAVQEALMAGGGFVYLWGQYGMAKTLILKIAVAEALRNGTQASYTDMFTIMRNIQASFDRDSNGKSIYSDGEEMRRIRHWGSIPLLAIDEIEVLKLTEYASSIRFTLIDDRWVLGARGQGVTLIAGNVSPQKLDDGKEDVTTQKILDRIMDGRNWIVELKGESMRPYMPKGVRI